MTRTALSPEAKSYLVRFGAVVRELRKEAGLLQEHLGVRLGTQGSRVGEIERGQIDTSLSRAIALARALGLPGSALLARVEDAAMDERAIDEMRARLAQLLRRLAPTDLNLVSAIVRRLLS